MERDFHREFAESYRRNVLSLGAELAKMTSAERKAWEKETGRRQKERRERFERYWKGLPPE